MEISLLILDPDGNPSWVRLEEGDTRVGRGADNDMVLAGRGVSRHHAVLKLDAGIFTVEDLDSTYGTRVCGHVVRHKQVGLGDPIDMGTFRIIPLPGTSTRFEPTAQGPSPFDPSTPTPFNLADTGEYHKAYTPRNLHVFMGAARPANGSDWGPDEETLLVGGPSDSPFRVQMVDGWGSEALSKVIRSSADMHGPYPFEDAGDIATSTDALDALYKLGELVAAATKSEQSLQASLDIIAGIIELDTAVVLEAIEGHRFQARAIRFTGRLERGEVPVSRSVVAQALKECAPVISENLASHPDYKTRDSVHLYKVGAVMALPTIVEDQAVGVLYLARGAGKSFAETELNFAKAATAMVAGLLYRSRLQLKMTTNQQRADLLERFLGPTLSRKLSSSSDPYGLEENTVTVLAAELADFERITATLPPERLMTIFADFHTMVREVVAANGGDVISAREGAALALFGLPEPKRTDAIWAVSAALDLVRHYDTSVRRRLGLQGGLKCGLTSGEVQSGVVGSTGILELVAVGRPVILARRLAEKAPPHSVLLEEETLNKIPTPNFKVQPISPEGLEDLAGTFYVVERKKTTKQT